MSEMTRCPDDEALMAWIDGRSKAGLSGHLERCPLCRGRERDYRRWAGRIKQSSSISSESCPSPGALLSGGRSIVKHMSQCVSCRENLAAARRREAMDPAPASLKRRLYAMTPRRILWPWVAGSIAAAALVLVSILMMARPSPAPIVIKRPPPVEREPERPIEQPLPQPEPPLPEPIPPPPEPEKPIEPPAPPEPGPRPPMPPPPEPPAKEEPRPTTPEPEKEKPKIRAVALVLSGQATIDGQVFKALQTREIENIGELRTNGSGAKVRIGEHLIFVQRRSDLTVRLEADGIQIDLRKGEAVFEARGAFAVKTSQGRITVQGTRFLVSADKDETEVVVQEGRVEFKAADRSVILSPGQRSSARDKGPRTPEKADAARRALWARALEDVQTIEAEQMAMHNGLQAAVDGSASGGGSIGSKGHLDHPAFAETRLSRKQPVRHALWMKVFWNHNERAGLSMSIGEKTVWQSTELAARPSWQWVRVELDALPAEPFRIRVADSKGGARIDQLVLTTDFTLRPE